MRVEVDMALCASHGQCEFSAPEVFGLDDEGDLHYVAEPDAAEAANIETAVNACPTGAIRVRE